MRPILTKLAATGAVMALAACAGTGLESARKDTTPPVGAFESVLYNGYLNLSQEEYQEGHYLASDAYAARATRLSNGGMVEPDTLTGHDLPPNTVGDLAEARARLVQALEHGARKAAPTDTANAQLGFDCWVEEQEENRQPDDIAACRTRYMTAMQSVQAAMQPPKAKAAPQKKMEKKSMATTGAMRKAGLYEVYFGFDKATLNGEAMQVIDSIAADYRKERPSRLVIAGHTDAAGPGGYNEQLSLRRVQAVVDALARAGVPRQAMLREAYGERDQAVQTRNGVREPLNRVVDVQFKK